METMLKPTTNIANRKMIKTFFILPSLMIRPDGSPRSCLMTILIARRFENFS